MASRVVAAALLSAGLIAGCTADRPADPPAQAVAAEPAWSDGRSIRWGELKITTGPRIRAFTHTADAVVWIDRAGAVWSADGQSEPERIGEAGTSHRLRADRWGSLVAWMEVPTTGSASLVVWDTARGTEVFRSSEGLSSDMRVRVNGYSELSPWPPRDQRPIAWVHAVDDGDVWWLGTEGTMRTEVANGETELVQSLAEGADEFTVLDVADGWIASWPFDQEEPDQSPPPRVGRTLSDGTVLDGEYGLHGLAVDGRLALTVLPGVAVRRTSDGSLVRRFEDEMRLGPWLDDTTFLAARHQRRDIEILTCRATSGECARYATIERTPHLEFPA